MNTFRSIMAFFQVILTLLGFGLLTIVLFQELLWPYNLMVGLIIMSVGIYTGNFVFRMISRRGYLTTMTGDNASYELDNLEPVPGNGVSSLTPNQLEIEFREGKIELNHCYIAIWGDSMGRKLKDKHKIIAIDYDVDKNIVSLIFVDNCLLKVKNPRIIHLTNSYLKIVKATEVLWQTSVDSEINRYNYLNTGKEIRTKSNTDWQPNSLDVGIGMNAIYLQG